MQVVFQTETTEIPEDAFKYWPAEGSKDSLPLATLDVRSLPAAFSLLKKTKADSHHGYMSTMVVGEENHV
ncbi:unnamed protein product [Porites evermanni]|uniref:Uncharacterized protein n=1 Tax=Porites evermanni TaxID=104178 RepID=A0ABN8LLN6_9CNID|nr:unnamed protein product [Porites evermanni]